MNIVEKVRQELEAARIAGKIPRVIYVGYKTYADLLYANRAYSPVTLLPDGTRFTFESYPIYKVDEEYYIAIGE